LRIGALTQRLTVERFDQIERGRQIQRGVSNAAGNSREDSTSVLSFVTLTVIIDHGKPHAQRPSRE
jgi:hypothetical protein